MTKRNAKTLLLLITILSGCSSRNPAPMGGSSAAGTRTETAGVTTTPGGTAGGAQGTGTSSNTRSSDTASDLPTYDQCVETCTGDSTSVAVEVSVSICHVCALEIAGKDEETGATIPYRDIPGLQMDRNTYSRWGRRFEPAFNAPAGYVGGRLRSPFRGMERYADNSRCGQSCYSNPTYLTHRTRCRRAANGMNQAVYDLRSGAKTPQQVIYDLETNVRPYVDEISQACPECTTGQTYSHIKDEIEGFKQLRQVPGNWAYSVGSALGSAGVGLAGRAADSLSTAVAQPLVRLIGAFNLAAIYAGQRLPQRGDMCDQRYRSTPGYAQACKEVVLEGDCSDHITIDIDVNCYQLQ